MFTRLLKASAAAAIAMSIGAAAAHAATTYVVQASSPVGWSSNGDHADLVLRYSGHAGVTLTVNMVGVIDISGSGINEVLNTCGSPVKTGDSVTSYQLSPGGLCFLRAYRSPAEIVGRVTVSDSTGNANSINAYVRTSLEVRDASDNVITHVEAR